MPALVLVPKFPQHDPLAVVRVSGETGAIHFASLSIFEKREERTVTLCTTRVGAARLRSQDVTCSWCSAPHVRSLNEPRDVTELVIAGCIA